MARTKASVGAKVSSGKSNKARCNAAPATHTSSLRSSGEKSTRNSYSGGNPVCPRETPKWQKPITNFFICKDTNSKDTEMESDEDQFDQPVAGPSKSKSKPKHNIIESDNESSDETPSNRVLDESIELEPLSGDSSHKLEEYYSVKRVDIDKESHKENVNNNNREEKKTVKRPLDDGNYEEIAHSSKKVRVGCC